jgi:hypothetical protein
VLDILDPTRATHPQQLPGRPAVPGLQRAGGSGGPSAGLPAQPALDLLLFSTDPGVVREGTAAGMAGFIVDWERRGKVRRQAGEGTQINNDTLADLRRVRVATGARVLCRINGFGPWTAREIDLAVEAGADEVLLPMVRRVEEVDRALTAMAGRAGLGILVETEDAVRAAGELARRPLSRIYVGLNDLRIDRGARCLFTPMVDGTVERVRAHAGDIPFGVAGLTLPDRGAPVPSRLLAAELARLGAGFTFLRRSFLADTAGQPLAPALAAIAQQVAELTYRTPEQQLADRAELAGAVRRWEHAP